MNENRTNALDIELGGRPLLLCYTVNTLCALEDRAEMPVGRLMDFQFSATRLLLWAGLILNQPELTVRDVGDLIDAEIHSGGSMKSIVDLCAEGLRASGLLVAGMET